MWSEIGYGLCYSSQKLVMDYDTVVRNVGTDYDTEVRNFSAIRVHIYK